MKKTDLDKYFVKSDIKKRGRILDSSEDIAETERINKEMRKAEREYKNRAALSWQLARNFCFTR